MVDVLRHSLKRLRDDRGGNFAIEFALVLPILALLLVGLLDLGRYSLQKSALLQGAREGAQYGMLAPTDTANIQTTAQNATGLSGVSAVAERFCECVAGTPVACTPSCGAGMKTYIKVTTTRNFVSVLSSNSVGGITTFMSHWAMPASISADVTMIVP
jgi:Flp pilus assembly protein TadG